MVEKNNPTRAGKPKQPEIETLPIRVKFRINSEKTNRRRKLAAGIKIAGLFAAAAIMTTAAFTATTFYDNRLLEQACPNFRSRFTIGEVATAFAVNLLGDPQYAARLYRYHCPTHK